jgi:membrane-bound lytic murein transglycosylase B
MSRHLLDRASLLCVTLATAGLVVTGLWAARPAGPAVASTVPVPRPVPVAAARAAGDTPGTTVSPGPAAAPGDVEHASAVVTTSPAPSAVPAVQPADDWVVATASATGVPPRALRAYAATQLRMDQEDAGCGIGWTTLAAIGAIESGHGTHGGAALDAAGRAVPLILGPALDGTGAFAAIPATAASTALDGDARWQHAVGPMQFLPSTWERWAADGDGDGLTDPHDLDDAALAAARYLCTAGGDLGTGAGWRAAVLAYNRSDAYADAVLDRAQTYASAAG